MAKEQLTIDELLDMSDRKFEQMMRDVCPQCLLLKVKIHELETEIRLLKKNQKRKK